MPQRARATDNPSAGLTLWIPGLLTATAPAPELRLPALERWLARGRRQRVPVSDMPSGVAWLAPDLARLLDATPPGPLSWLGETGERPRGWCCRADPVYLEPVADDLRLVAAEQLGISPDEARVLEQAFNAHFDEALHLEAPHPERWYLYSLHTLRVETTPPGQTLTAGAMPRGPDGGVLRRLMTEAQMLFHGHPVNLARCGAGRPAINSIWPWGGGELRAPGPSLTLPTMWSDDALLRGLWRFAGGRAEAVEPVASVLHERGGASGVVHLQGMARQRVSAEGEALSRELRSLEDTWMAPLWQELARGTVQRLGLLTDAGWLFLVDRGSRRRFWRRLRPLRAWSRMPG